MWWWHGDWSGWGWLAMTATMVAFWGLVAWVIAAIVRGARPSGDDPPGPEEILARRFAAGAIDEEEYQRRLAALRQEPSGARR